MFFLISALQSRKAGNDGTASVYDALQYQIWSLLPNFCDGAMDIATAFPVLARTLGSAITERADIRPLAMQALRSLISSCKDADDRYVVLGCLEKRCVQNSARFRPVEAKLLRPKVLDLHTTVFTVANSFDIYIYARVFACRHARFHPASAFQERAEAFREKLPSHPFQFVHDAARRFRPEEKRRLEQIEVTRASRRVGNDPDVFRSDRSVASAQVSVMESLGNSLIHVLTSVDVRARFS